MMPSRRFTVAVVVVARNADETISAAMDSIVAQDYDDFQVVFIDDASSDFTFEKVLAFGGRCSLTACRMEEHRGLAEGLGRALALCSSEYVIVCDADDVLRPGALGVLANEARLTNADIVMAPMVTIADGKERLMKLNKVNSLNDMPIDTAHFSLCNKLMRLDWILSECMPYGGIDCWEDLGVIARFMAMEPKVSIIDTPVYNYIRRPGITTLSSSPKYKVLPDRLAMARELAGWFEKKGLSEKYGEFINHMKFYAKIKLARNPGRNIKAWASTFPEINSKLLRFRHVPLRYRLLCCFVLFLLTNCSLKRQ